ncbi:YybH family protein [Paraferrimonas sedimenticola]|uniref:Periplasmic L-asparaginase n=1 Tax=Paraferrimonas sedimenticola TaxID=375674 RepID=A0AA37W2M4_9GAMM|nr:DUF4440 domain-containing protein [Paraferrimonas sedimenticola]GLP97813.1 periplasmic L-asparaginase [Paraferrimonas sedimenticola]
MRTLVLLVCLILSFGAKADDANQQIRVLLQTQVKAWNSGDIESFMEAFWADPRLRFISRGKVRYGWQSAYEAYLRNYPDRDAMGRLSFNIELIDLLNADQAIVVGRWQLVRKDDQPNGIFTLVLQRFDGGWRIIHDHTS